MSIWQPSKNRGQKGFLLLLLVLLLPLLEGNIKELLVNGPNNYFSFGYQKLCRRAWWLATKCRHVAHLHCHSDCRMVKWTPRHYYSHPCRRRSLCSLLLPSYLCILEEAACEMPLSRAPSFTLLLS